MRFEVENLTPEGEPFAHVYAQGELSLEDEQAQLLEGARVEGRISRRDEEVIVKGRLAGGVEVVCDRCLKPFVTPVEVEFEERFLPASSDAPMGDEAAGLQDEELSLSVYDDEEIDLDELVREEVLLALPARRLCRQECKGLCPHCGADLNVEDCGCADRQTDPRWAGLSALKTGDQ